MTPQDNEWFKDLADDPNDGILSDAKIRRAVQKLREINAQPPEFYEVRWQPVAEAWTVCLMCRMALHKKCLGNCNCDCARGY